MATTSLIQSNQHQFGAVYYFDVHVEVDVGDWDTDASGDLTITFADFKGILEESVFVSLQAGFFAAVQSVAGNVVTIRTYAGKSDGLGAAAEEMPSYDSQTDVSKAFIKATGW